MVLRFSRFTQKQEWMIRTAENIGLPTYSASTDELLKILDSSNFNVIQAMYRAFIDAETINMHYSAHQSWSKKGLKKNMC